MRMKHLLTALATTLVLSTTLVGCASPDVRPAATRSPSLTPITTFGPMPATALDASDTAALQRALDDAVGPTAPGLLATVITSRGIWTGAAGVDGPRERKAQPGDVFPMASITKTFTSALIHRLAEEGRIDLDARLSTYLSGAAAKESNGATVRQALAMRAGIPDTTDESRMAAYDPPTRVSTPDQIVASMPKPTASPGGPGDYSNPTYKLLAIAATRAGGATWPDLVRTKLVEPAHVPGTLVVQTADTRTPGTFMVPTIAGAWGAGGTLPFVADSSFSYGASDMAADSRSLAMWGWALLAGRIVSPASLTQMAENDGTDIGSGLDTFVGGGVPSGSLGHGGSKEGYTTVLVADPGTQTMVVLAVNTEDAQTDTIAGSLFQAAQG